MIRKIPRAEVPPMGKPRSPMRQFAFEAVRDFIASDPQTGDVFRVEGFVGEGDPTVAGKVVSALDAEIHAAGRTKTIDAFRRREQVFLEAVESNVVQRYVREYD